MSASHRQPVARVVPPLILTLAAGFAACANNAPAPQDIVRSSSDVTRSSSCEEPYRFQAGDVFRVNVRTAPELDAERIIAPDGSVSLPLIGRIAVAGQSGLELQVSLEERYATELRDPSLQVSAVAFADPDFKKLWKRCPQD